MEVMPLLDGEDGSLNSLMEQMDIGLVPKNLEMWFVPLPIMKPPTPPPFISPSPLLAVSTSNSVYFAAFYFSYKAVAIKTFLSNQLFDYFNCWRWHTAPVVD